jgi:Zn-dependent M28 family amino/carboxypeptidase
VQGGVSSTLGASAAEVARRAGWETRLQPAGPNSDHFPFLRAGVPAVFLVPAPGPYEALTTDSSQALRRRWDRYHRPSDEWRSDFPLDGLVRYAQFGWLLGDAIASGPRPAMLAR